MDIRNIWQEQIAQEVKEKYALYARIKYLNSVVQLLGEELDDLHELVKILKDTDYLTNSNLEQLKKVKEIVDINFVA